MQKRLSLVLVTCLLLNIGVPVAGASSLENQLANLAGKSAAINSSVQQLTELKEAVQAGDEEKVLGLIAAAVAKKAQQDYNLPDSTGSSVQETVKQAAQQAIEQKVQEKLAAKGAPYQDIVSNLGLLQQLQGFLNPAVNKQSNSLAGAPENYTKIIDVTATAYAPGVADNGHWGDKTYVGTLVRKGVVAVDPSVIPMGTKLWVEGYGYAVAEDQGSAIKGNRIDLAFNDRQTALDYGIQKVKVYVLE